MDTKSVNFSQVNLWQSGLIRLRQEPLGFRSSSFFFQRVVSRSLSRRDEGSPDPPPLQPSASVADRAEPRECKKKKSINITSTSPIHVLLSNLASLPSLSPNSLCCRPHYTKSCCFACNQIPRHFSPLENKVAEGHYWKALNTTPSSKAINELFFFLIRPPARPRELFFLKCRGHKDNYRQSQFKYSWLHRHLLRCRGALEAEIVSAVEVNTRCRPQK